MNLLLINAGSSSLKVLLFDRSAGTEIASAHFRVLGNSRVSYGWVRGSERRTKEIITEAGRAIDYGQLLGEVLSDLDSLGSVGRIDAVGHRIVHGGDMASAVLITPEVEQRVREISLLAPLHNPPALAALKVAMAALPAAAHVAVFDTAFHRTMVREASLYPVPKEWEQRYGIKRYGFHGLSHSYCGQRVAELLSSPRGGELRVIVCHLGHGCSAAAIKGGRCVDTTMGFTPLEGLMMATRSGSIDPGALLHLLRIGALSIDELSHQLNYESGIAGVSGVSSDMREVLAAEAAGNPEAALAVAMFCHRVQQAIGALFVTLGEADVVVFTAGIGENAPIIRERIAAKLSGLGLLLDPTRNRESSGDTIISTPTSPRTLMVIHTREEIAMAEEVTRVLANR